MTTRIGILHPGQMGASVGAAARSGGHRVLWTSEGRSEHSRRRAVQADLEDAGALSDVVEEAEVIVSVCPPASAERLASSVAELGFGGVYVDANAVAPATAMRIADAVESAGARFVDGGIIGPPATEPGRTRLYLSGEGAAPVAELFEGSLLGARVVDEEPGSASALKMCYAAWTKGSSALLMAVRALAAARGVEAALIEEWEISQVGLSERSRRGASANALKAWRFEGEMREIAATFAADGLPEGFHTAAAEVYRRLSPFKDRDPAPEVAEVIQTLHFGFPV